MKIVAKSLRGKPCFGFFMTNKFSDRCRGFLSGGDASFTQKAGRPFLRKESRPLLPVTVELNRLTLYFLYQFSNDACCRCQLP